MPNFNEVLNEIAAAQSGTANAVDVVRRKYLQALHKHTGRNVICYYSGWLQWPNLEVTSVGDDDKNGFMSAIHGLDRKLGLDLLLHTPGGNVAATESLVHYLRQIFKTDIRAIVPQMAMSAGTMIACACKSIVMGRQSNIGPIDPHFHGMPCWGVIAEFERACYDMSRGQNIPAWQAILARYHPTFLGECENALELSEQLVEKWLKTGMFEGDADAESKAKRVLETLNRHDTTLTHSRHIHLDEAEEMGLKIERLETQGNETLQDLVLTIHHAYMYMFSTTMTLKIVENHTGNAIASFGRQS